jgi:NAD(P)H dehydrogenase (quinone)
MIGITGASGNLGSAIIKDLLPMVDKNRIIAFIRNKNKTQRLTDLGIEARLADYADKESFVTGLKDIDTLLLISASEIGNRLNQHKNVIDAAKESGVKTFIYTSFVMAKKPDWKLLLEHFETEDYIKKSGLSYVICRDSHYLEPMVADMARINNEGTYYTSASGGFAYVTVHDLARTYAVLLANPAKRPLNQTINLTGPSLITPEKYFELMQKKSTKELKFKRVSEEEMKKYLESLNVSPKAMEGWLGFERMQSKGIVSVISDDIKNITGIAPTSMEDYM